MTFNVIFHKHQALLIRHKTIFRFNASMMLSEKVLFFGFVESPAGPPHPYANANQQVIII